MESSTRKSNFDLMKILLILMVLILHFNNVNIGGAFKTAVGGELLFLKFLQSFSAVAVNCFILISGYFLCNNKKIKFEKIFLLFVLNLLYNIACVSLTYICFDTPFILKNFIFNIVRQTYFINFYIVLLILSPLLNNFFKLSKKTEMYLLLIFGFLFSFFPSIVKLFATLFDTDLYIGFSFITMNGNEQGYTVVNFIFLYLLGGFINKFFEDFKIKHKKALVIFTYISSLITVYVLSIWYPFVWYYDNFLLIIESISLFLCFYFIPIKSNKALQIISSASLGVYILHTSDFFVHYIFPLFKIETHVGAGIGETIIVLLAFLSIIFSVCFCLDFVIRYPLSYLFKKIKIPSLVIEDGIQNK